MKNKRLIHQILVVLGLSLIGMLFYYLMYFLTDANFGQEFESSLSSGWILLDFTVSCMFTTVVTLYYWKSRERAEKERDRLRLQVLDNQLSPHFVFNNFSILAELIEVNPKKASEYLMHLSKVYRYMLSHQEQTTVSLQEELKYLGHYLSLLHERFGDSIRVSIDPELQNQSGQVPPLVLQMLIENAIKHNEHTESHPLMIDMVSDHGKILVKNHKQLVEKPDSAHVGLHNIEERYHLLVQKGITVKDTPDDYCVIIPLIEEKS